MICLECGHDNRYGADQCGGCELLFEPAPPFLKANHLSQLQELIHSLAEGHLNLPGARNRLARFLELHQAFDHHWNLGPEALSPALAHRFGRSWQDLSSAYDDLGEGLALLESFLESGEPIEFLETAQTHIESFFVVACREAQAILAGLENAVTPSLDLDLQ